MSTASKRNITYIDILKLCSIFIVIYAHTSTDGFYLFANYPNNSLQFWLYLFFSIGSRFPIPIFFAISGLLQLGKDEPLQNIWRKKILQMFLIYVVISFLYYVENTLIGINNLSDFSIISFIKSLYYTSHKPQLWYIGEYITFLMCLPFLRALVKSLETKYYYYMIAIAAFFKLLPVVEYILWQGNYTLYYPFKISWLISDIVLYPLFGYFIHNYVSNTQLKKFIFPSIVVFIIATLLSCVATYKLGIAQGEYSEVTGQFFIDSTNFLSCIALFVTVKYICSVIDLKPVFISFVSQLGKLTFGTYLLHFFLLDIGLLRQCLRGVQAKGMNDIVAAWIYSLVIMILSYTLSYILSKIPYVKKLIGL